jgi:hypothetical protein
VAVSVSAISLLGSPRVPSSHKVSAAAKGLLTPAECAHAKLDALGP